MTVLSNYDTNYTDKPQMSPFVNHTELGSRVRLISFEHNRAPVNPWRPPPKGFKDHRNYIYWQWPQPHGLSAQVNDTNPIPHDGDLLSSPGDLPELCHHTTELSWTADFFSHLLNIPRASCISKDILQSLIWQKNCLAYLDLQKTAGFGALAPVDN